MYPSNPKLFVSFPKIPQLFNVEILIHILSVIGALVLAHKLELLTKLIKSFVPSRTEHPPDAELYTAPFFKVPVFPLPVRSVIVVPDPG
jgi:hypothetical protein